MDKLLIVASVWAGLIATGSGVAVPAGLFAQDTVTYRNSDDSQVRRKGTILDVNSRRLLVQFGDRESTIAFDKVVSLESRWDFLATRGDQLFAERQFELAYREYGGELDRGSPEWFRRRLLAGQVQSAREMQSWHLAVTAFQQLLESDRETQYLSTAPMAWTATRPDASLDRLLATANATTDPWLRLIFASHNLSGRSRSAAIDTLRNLQTDADRTIATLADCQLWRIETTPTDAAELERRQLRVESLPEGFRAGPFGLLGEQWSTIDRERAVLCWMRIPVSYPEQFGLAARSLLQSADLLIKMDRTAEARIVLSELVAVHANTVEATAGNEMLRQLNGRTTVD